MSTKEYHDQMSKHGEFQVLIILSQAFIAGEGRNQNFVRQLEGLYAGAIDLHDDPRFEELEEAFAMYGSSHTDNGVSQKTSKKSPASYRDRAESRSARYGLIKAVMVMMIIIFSKM